MESKCHIWMEKFGGRFQIYNNKSVLFVWMENFWWISNRGPIVFDINPSDLNATKMDSNMKGSKEPLGILLAHSYPLYESYSQHTSYFKNKNKTTGKIDVSLRHFIEHVMVLHTVTWTKPSIRNIRLIIIANVILCFNSSLKKIKRKKKQKTVGLTF